MSTIEKPATIPARCRAAVLQAVTALGGEGSRRDILALAERLAAFSPADLALLPPEKHRRQHGRLVDYKLSWALSDLKREGRLENPRWSHWQFPKPEIAPDQLAAPVSPERLLALKTMPYRDYLKTLEWQHTRLAALRRAEHRCQFDAQHDAGRLDVHHSSYDRRGCERSSDLIVLCADCHGRHHAHADPATPASVPPPAATTPRAAAPPPANLLRRLLGRRG